MERLTSRIYYLPPQPERDRPALGYIRGERRCLMVDAGNSPAHAGDFLRQLDALHLPRPDGVVLTHRHWDHTFGLCALDCPALCGEATARHLQRFAAISWGDAGLQEYIDLDGLRGFSEPHLRLEYPDPAAIRLRPAEHTLNGTLTLDLGGCRCVVRTIPSPHSDDCVLVYVPEERVLFTGDACCLQLLQGQWVDRPEQAAALLRLLEELPFEWAIVGHDLPQTRQALFAELRSRI